MGSGGAWWLVSLAGAALVTATVSRRWVWQAALIYLFSPLILFFGAILWLLATQPGAAAGLGMAVFGLALVSSVAALPWILTCLLGFGLGLLPRRWLRPAPPLPTPQVPAPLPAEGWRPLHVGVEHDEAMIGGLPAWREPWRPAGLPPLQLPHPTYPEQRHRFEIFDIGAGATQRRFAAGELSNGVWCFYEPIPPPPPAPLLVAAAPKLPIAWRSLGAILLAAIIMIALGTILTLRLEPPPPPLTPLPRMPGAAK